jgi:outer membrane murein-binding lipoprotein Lpp
MSEMLKMKITGSAVVRLAVAAAASTSLLLSGCATSGRSPSYHAATQWGSVTTQGVKGADEVAPHARGLATGQETLAQAFQRPESKQDGGVAVMNAVKDLPVN